VACGAKTACRKLAGSLQMLAGSLQEACRKLAGSLQEGLTCNDALTAAVIHCKSVNIVDAVAQQQSSHGGKHCSR
jgi:hypothetical protein